MCHAWERSRHSVVTTARCFLADRTGWAEPGAGATTPAPTEPRNVRRVNMVGTLQRIAPLNGKGLTVGRAFGKVNELPPLRTLPWTDA